MFFEPFTEFISLRSNLLCSAELTIGFDPRYFVSLLHLLRICVKTLPLAGNEAIRRKVRG